MYTKAKKTQSKTGDLVEAVHSFAVSLSFFTYCFMNWYTFSCLPDAKWCNTGRLFLRRLETSNLLSLHRWASFTIRPSLWTLDFPPDKIRPGRRCAAVSLGVSTLFHCAACLTVVKWQLVTADLLPSLMHQDTCCSLPDILTFLLAARHFLFWNETIKGR